MLTAGHNDLAPPGRATGVGTKQKTCRLPWAKTANLLYKPLGECDSAPCEIFHSVSCRFDRPVLCMRGARL
jgi:hypothetical protein